MTYHRHTCHQRTEYTVCPAPPPIQLCCWGQQGMNFITKSIQLSMKKFITKPQEEDLLSTRAAFFADVKNMFNSVSRDALMESIRVSFPEFLPLAHILYGAPGLVHHHWGDGSWRIIEMLEGVNRGCPLSALFAALVLDRVIRPLDSMLRK